MARGTDERVRARRADRAIVATPLQRVIDESIALAAVAHWDAQHSPERTE
jgi:hypothetical protein